MTKKMSVEKEKLIANLSPLVIYLVSAILLVLVVLSSEKLYHVEVGSRFLWAFITIALTVFGWLTALIGFYSYLYAFKYDVKKSIVLIALCYLLIIIGIVSFYIVMKIMP